jgi:amidophosphoribosyltransferase
MPHAETAGWPEVEEVPEEIDLYRGSEEKPRDHCGVVGIYAPGEPVAALAVTAIGDLQNRGQSGAGVAVYHPDEGFIVHKGLGKVVEAFDDLPADADGRTVLDRTTHSPVAISHTRYSTAGEDTIEGTHPHINRRIAVAHNGEFQNHDLAAAVFGYDIRTDVSDSHATTDLLAQQIEAKPEGMSVEDAILEILPWLDGAYCLTITDGENVYAVRDPWATHPLALGRLEAGGYIVASEPVAFHKVGATFVRDVAAGEMLVIGPDGVRSRTIERQADPAPCAYEYFYTGRGNKGNALDGVSVVKFRRELGRIMGSGYAHDIDVVVGMPDTGTAAAFGFAEASGATFVPGVVKNPAAGRSFQQRGDARAATLADKAWPIPEFIDGMRVAVVDDSMIKGNTNRANIGLFKAAGALEVHVVLAAPPYRNSCRMGMDTGDPNQLIANRLGDDYDAMAAEIGADSVTYISPGQVQQVYRRLTGNAAAKLCLACTTGEYPYMASSPYYSGRAATHAGRLAAAGVALPRNVRLLPIAGN